VLISEYFQKIESQIADCIYIIETSIGKDKRSLYTGIILFFSLLDEKQRRLYAGLEAAKLGHGGDRKIADLLGLDPHTVAKGRQALFSGSVDRSDVRNSGGGRKRVEKNSRNNGRNSNPS